MTKVDSVLRDFYNTDDDSFIQRQAAIRELQELRATCLELKTAAYSDDVDYPDTDIHWEKVFDAVFSDHISKRVYALVRILNGSFDYYDPDTTYQEDVSAFIDAFDQYVSEHYG